MSMEPQLKCESAIYSETSGIIDSHGIMKYFLSEAEHNGAQTVFNTEVIKINKKPLPAILIYSNYIASLRFFVDF